MRFSRTPSNIGYLVFSLLSFGFLAFVYYSTSPSVSQTVPGIWKEPDPKPDYSAEKVDIQPDQSGVMVFLHIQKTGGTEFGRHLLFLDVGRPCRLVNSRIRLPKGSKCYRPGPSGKKNKETWLFSRFSTGWPCGVHADWTELHECVEETLNKKEGVKEREFFYVTMLREPIARFVSEFAHVKRGATWATTHHCNKHKWNIPDCYPGYSDKKPWPNLTWRKFLSCKSNLGINRQTRMLANLTLVSCYDTKKFHGAKRDQLILDSAKANLRSLPYFGLNEYQIESKELFEYTFGLKFTDEFRILNETESKSKTEEDALTENDISWIREANCLDVQLYDYAQKLFLDRVSRMRRNETSLRYVWKQYLLIDNSETEDT